jgi:hypothetical protein
MKTKTAPAIITRHDYISVDFGNNRRLTASFGGEKASGAVPAPVFDLWSKAMTYQPAVLVRLGMTDDCKRGELVQRFVDQIDTIWPEWHVAPTLPAVGEPVTVHFGKRRGSETGTVTAIRGTMITATFPTQGVVRFAADMIER